MVIMGLTCGNRNKCGVRHTGLHTVLHTIFAGHVARLGNGGQARYGARLGMGLGMPRTGPPELRKR
jgi:hypothetical protein